MGWVLPACHAFVIQFAKIMIGKLTPILCVLIKNIFVHGDWVSIKDLRFFVNQVYFLGLFAFKGVFPIIIYFSR